jgi:hypothetical protein
VVVRIKLTWNNIPSIHGIFILDESKAIHQLDLGDLARFVGSKVGFNIGLGGWEDVSDFVATSSQVEIYGSPARGRFPKYRRVAETSLLILKIGLSGSELVTVYV